MIFEMKEDGKHEYFEKTDKEFEMKRIYYSVNQKEKEKEKDVEIIEDDKIVVDNEENNEIPMDVDDEIIE
jgi:hypothetical protein